MASACRADEVRASSARRHRRGAAIGHKVSRAPRTKMLRTARIAIGGVEGDVRIRNISTSAR